MIHIFHFDSTQLHVLSFHFIDMLQTTVTGSLSLGSWMLYLWPQSNKIWSFCICVYCRVTKILTHNFYSYIFIRQILPLGPNKEKTMAKILNRNMKMFLTWCVYNSTYTKFIFNIFLLDFKHHIVKNALVGSDTLTVWNFNEVSELSVLALAKRSSWLHIICISRAE